MKRVAPAALSREHALPLRAAGRRSIVQSSTCRTWVPASRWKVPSEFRTHLILCWITHPSAVAALYGGMLRRLVLRSPRDFRPRVPSFTAPPAAPARRHALQKSRALARASTYLAIASRLIASRSQSRRLIERNKSSTSPAAPASPAKNLASAAVRSRRKPFMFNPLIFSRNCSAILTSSLRSGSMRCENMITLDSRVAITRPVPPLRRGSAEHRSSSFPEPRLPLFAGRRFPYAFSDGHCVTLYSRRCAT
jgi:hypothetical protein